MISTTSLPAPDALRQVLDETVLPLSERREDGEIVGLGAVYRLFVDATLGRGGFLPIYRAWIAEGAGIAARNLHDMPHPPEGPDGAPALHSLRADLSPPVGHLLAPRAGPEILQFEILFAREGVLAFSRSAASPVSEARGDEDIRLAEAAPWTHMSRHARLGFASVARFLAAELGADPG